MGKSPIDIQTKVGNHAIEVKFIKPKRVRDNQTGRIQIVNKPNIQQVFTTIHNEFAQDTQSELSKCINCNQTNTDRDDMHLTRTVENIIKQNPSLRPEYQESKYAHSSTNLDLFNASSNHNDINNQRNGKSAFIGATGERSLINSVLKDRASRRKRPSILEASGRLIEASKTTSSLDSHASSTSPSSSTTSSSSSTHFSESSSFVSNFQRHLSTNKSSFKPNYQFVRRINNVNVSDKDYRAAANIGIDLDTSCQRQNRFNYVSSVTLNDLKNRVQIPVARVRKNSKLYHTNLDNNNINITNSHKDINYRQQPRQLTGLTITNLICVNKQQPMPNAGQRREGLRKNADINLVEMKQNLMQEIKRGVKLNPISKLPAELCRRNNKGDDFVVNLDGGINLQKSNINSDLLQVLKNRSRVMSKTDDSDSCSTSSDASFA